MKYSSVPPENRLEEIVREYGNLLYRLCFVMLGSESDAEDAVQESFIKYLKKAPPFQSAEHEKAWLIAVAANQCKDFLRFRKRHPQIELEHLREASNETSDSGILEALMTLPEKFRLVLTLYYVEEYRVEEIAKIIGRTHSAVKMRLQKGRKLLEETFRKEYL
ncbi:MAG: RNA polymerase sigma factor [Oscillospiraceae bacterium]|nr:RNA polymerase sigma factor [Oscillospiraceae bacterium]